MSTWKSLGVTQGLPIRDGVALPPATCASRLQQQGTYTEADLLSS
ncbi:unnamed protein product, partial [Laminaria digitata]